MAGENLERKLSYSVDPSIEKAKQKLAELAKEEQTLAKQILNADSASAEQTKQLKSLQKAQRDLQTVLKASGADFQDQSQDIEQATRALSDYEDRLQSVKRGGADFGGDVASAASGTRAGLDAITGGNLPGGVSGGFEFVEGLADLREFAPQLATQIDTLGNVMRSGDSAAAGLVTELGDGIANMTGLSAGMGSFIAVAAPAAIILTGLAVGYQQLQRIQQEQIDTIRAEAEGRRDVFSLVNTGATEQEAFAELARIQQEIVDRQSTLLEPAQQAYDTFLSETTASQRNAIEASSNIADSFLGNFSVVRQGLNLLEETTERLSGALAFGTQQLNASEEEFNRIRQEEQAAIDELQASYDLLQREIEAGTFAANDAAAAESELAATREQETARLQAEYEQSINRAAQLSAQRQSIIDSTAQSEADAAELAAVQAEIDRENELTELSDHIQKMEDIRIQGNERIEQLEAQYQTLAADRQNELAKVQKDGNQKLSDLQREYQKDTAQEYKDYAKDLARSTDSAAKSIRRLIEDINQSLDDATRANDVEAFLRAQRDGQTRLQRAREDASDDQAKLVQDFIDAREKERDVFLEKQAEIRASIQEEKQQVIQAYDERRNALYAQIEAEKVALDERLRQQQQQFTQQQERERIREEQQSRIAAIRERQQQQAEQRRLDAIAREAQAEQAASAAYLASIMRIQQAAASINVGGRQSPVDTPLGNFITSGARGAGNIFSTFAPQINQTVGDVASKEDVKRETESVLGNFISGFGNVLSTVVNR